MGPRLSIRSSRLVLKVSRRSQLAWLLRQSCVVADLLVFCFPLLTYLILQARERGVRMRKLLLVHKNMRSTRGVWRNSGSGGCWKIESW